MQQSTDQKIYELAQTVAAQTAQLEILTISTKKLFILVEKHMSIIPLLKLSAIVTFGFCAIILITQIGLWVNAPNALAATKQLIPPSITLID